MILAQLSDLHIGTRHSAIETRHATSEHLRAAIAHCTDLRARPDALVVTGDLVDEGAVEEYHQLESILEPLSIPIYFALGNHDARPSFRRVFGPKLGYIPDTGPIHYKVEIGPINLIVLDTHVPGEPGGSLEANQLAWLDATLEHSQRPTIIAMHHPPFVTGLAPMDRMGLAEPDLFETTVRRHPHVERIICGHIHVPIVTRFGGTVASVCPSTAHQLVPDLSANDSVVLAYDPPAVQLHAWRGGSVVSHTSYVGSKPIARSS